MALLHAEDNDHILNKPHMFTHIYPKLRLLHQAELWVNVRKHVRLIWNVIISDMYGAR